MRSLMIALCLIAATPEKDLVDTEKTKVLLGMRPDDIARISPAQRR